MTVLSTHMGIDRCAELSERERQCLRLVYEHCQSKEIARELGISKRTVDGYLDSARTKLEVANRIEAARLLYSFELPYRISGEPIRVPPDSPSRQTDLANAAEKTLGGSEVGEARTVFVHDPLDPLLTLPISTEGRPANDLDTWQRIATIGRIAGRLIFYPALILMVAEIVSQLALRVAG